MGKTAFTILAKIAGYRINVTGLQDSVKGAVKQDGQETIVVIVRLRFV